MTPARFAECLALCYWTQSGLSAILKCDIRHIERWASGEAEIPTSVAAWLETLGKVHAEVPPRMGWKRRAPDLPAAVAAHPALIGKAGEMLVAAELMRRGVEVAQPHSDVGVDLLAYRLGFGATVPRGIVGIQVKSTSSISFSFQKLWFKKAPVLVLAWKLATTPEFYVFDSLDRVEEALGPQYASSKSWAEGGRYTATKPTADGLARMAPHLGKWERITARL